MMHALVTIKNNHCTVECENHYSGYGKVHTKLGKEIYIKGTPRLYECNSISGIAQDEIIKEEGNKKSALLMQELLKEPDMKKWGSYLAGSFLLIVVDRGKSNCSVITDLGNSFHLYQGRIVDGLAFSTCIDLLAMETKKQNIDYVSIAEYLINRSVTYPYTEYVDLYEAPYAACLSCDYNQDKILVDEFQYWLPSCSSEESSDDLEELSLELREGILGDTKDILKDKKNVGLFLSGGTDSRVLAGLVAHLGITGHAITAVEAENVESETAGQVAKANGLKHEILLRDTEYYPRIAKEFIALEGPHAPFTWATHLGLQDKINAYGFDAILGGYMSDTLLKLHEANVTPRYFLGRHLGPLKKFNSAPLEFLRGGDKYIEQFAFLFRPEILEEIKKRRKKTMEYWNSLRADGSAWEWSWMWPFSRNKMNPNLTTNIFYYPAYEVFSDRAIIEIARVASQKIKINGRLFNKAMQPFTKRSAHIPLATTQLPMFKNSFLDEFAILLKHLPPRRWIFRQPPDLEDKNPVATNASWPDAHKLWKHSSMLNNFRSQYSLPDFENNIFLPRETSVFDISLYQKLPKSMAINMMYMMLHYDCWYKGVIRTH